MNFRNLLILLGILAFQVSCSKPSPTDMCSLFENSEQLSPSGSTIENSELRKPYLMDFSDGYLLLADLGQEHAFSIYDVKTGKLIQEVGTRGTGPNEILHVSSTKYNDKKITLFDAGSSQIHTITEPLSEDSHHELVPMQMNDTLQAAFNVIPVGNNHYVASGIIIGNRLALMDEKGNIETCFGDYPSGHVIGNTDIENGFIYQCVLVYNPVSQVLGVACGMGQSISFYDLKNQNNPSLIKEHTFEQPAYMLTKETGSPVAFTKDAVYGFIDAKPFNNNIVCLYSGEPLSPKNFGGNKLMIFDESGNPVKRIDLNKSYLNIATDSDNGIIYLLGSNEDVGYFIDMIKC